MEPTAPNPPKKLTPKQAAFVAEYLVDLNATQAAIRAGYSARVAAVTGAKLVINAKVAAAIAAGQSDRLERLHISQDDVLRQIWLLFTANPNELVEFRRVNCPVCWPDTVVDDMNWRGNREPNLECTGCRGDGMGYAHFKDTRNLSPAALRLYAGVKQTKEGLEMRMHDPLSVLPVLAKHVGLGGPNVNVNFDFEKLTDAQLEHIAKGGSLDALPR